VCHIFAVNRKTGLGERPVIPRVKAIRHRRNPADQVGPAGRGSAQRLVSLPARYRLMIARQ